MNDHIKVFAPDSDNYQQLIKVLNTLKKLYPEKEFVIATLYFDSGQDWEWTTILTKSTKTDMTYQLFTPNQQKDILNPSLDLDTYLLKLRIL